MDATLTYGGRNVTFYDIDPTSHIGNCLLKVCWYELPNLEFIRGLQVEGNYVDVGAYIGTHALYFSLFCPAKHVYAFEPCARFCHQLEKNISANGIKNCSPCRLGLMDTMYATIPPDAGEVFPVATLDSLHIDNVKLMKIDVESDELAVLKGAAATLRTVDHLFVELWPVEVCRERNVDYSFGHVSEFLRSYNLHHEGQLPWEHLHYFGKEDKRKQVQDLWVKTYGREYLT